MKRPYSIVLLSVAALLALLFISVSSGPAMGQGPIEPEEGPRSVVGGSNSSQSTGFVPPEIDLSHLTYEDQSGVASAAGLPSAFDWRDVNGVNYVTPVKNQGTCGACYAFAAVGNFEARMRIDGASPPGPDYSENHAKECNWYASNVPGMGSCGGGNYQMVANLWAKKGTVLEADDPYTTTSGTCASPTGPFRQTLLGWHIVSGSVVPPTAVLKQALLDHGPLYTALYVGNGDAWDTEFAGYNGSYVLHYTGPVRPPNHAVVIVGWDDAMTYPGGSGAWIVKNSWGTGWGKNGYFFIAYGSAQIGSYTSYLDLADWQPYDPYGELWYYDEAGMTKYVGYRTKSAWAANVFTATTDVYATRMEFWAPDRMTDVDFYLYDTSNGATPLWQSLDHNFPEAGYHSIPIRPMLPLTAGSSVTAVIKATAQTITYPIAIDGKGPADHASYLSSDGTQWHACTYGDVGLRLRVTTEFVNVGIKKAVVGRSFGYAASDPITFTLRVSNTGSVPAVGVVVTDIIPSEIVMRHVTSTMAITPTGSAEYVWQVAPLSPGAEGVITVSGVISSSLVGKASFVNRAAIAMPGDRVALDNSDQVFIWGERVFLPLVMRQ